MKTLSLLIITSACTLLFNIGSSGIKSVNLSDEEFELYEMVMEYRRENNLKSIPISISLTYVAQKHCDNLSSLNMDYSTLCSLHSWVSTEENNGCCYPESDECMISKPSELTNYSYDGYEIATSYEAVFSHPMPSEIALESWKNSKDHNNVILNLENWSSFKWNAIGIGNRNGIACIWFGTEVDEDGAPGLPW